MKNFSRNVLFGFLLMFAAGVYGAVPPMRVIVSDASGRLAFQGATSEDGLFATSPLRAGHYVVQFRSGQAASGDARYALVVSAGRKKVSALGIAAERFGGGGVAVKINAPAGSRLVGQVAGGLGLRVDASNLVWVPQEVGSHLPGHWALAGSTQTVPMHNSTRWGIESLRRIQDHGDVRH